MIAGGPSMNPPEEEKSPRTLWLMWGAFTYSVLIYGVVGYLVRRSSSLSLATEMLPILTPLFSVIGLAETSAVFYFVPSYFKTKSYVSYCMIRWALAEAIGTQGLVLFLLGTSWMIFGTFLGWALLLNFMMMPNENDRSKFNSLRIQ